MLLSMYMFLALLNVLCIVIAFLKDDKWMFGWLAILISFSLSVISLNIETVFCEAGSGTWECYNYAYEDIPLVWFWGGMGILMLAFSIYMTFFAITQPKTEDEHDRRE